jgi:hypothetical protein
MTPWGRHVEILLAGAMSLSTAYVRPVGDVHVCLAVAVLAVLYAAMTAVLADHGLVLEAQANLFLPYVAAPFACGVALAERRFPLAAVVGGFVALAMVVAFYVATQATSAFTLNSWGIEFWGAAALPAGVGAAAAGRAGAARLARYGRWRIVLSLLLAGAVLVAWLVGPALYRAAEVLVAGQITVLVVTALLNVEFGWLRNQQLASRG